jgi:hypothetical protein
MPTIQIPGPYEFGFFSNENAEPAHVHAAREGKERKFLDKPGPPRKELGLCRP